MFFPPLLGTILSIIYVIIGAGIGAALGWYSADLLRLNGRRPWLDAAMGAAAILVLYSLIASMASGARIVNDDTLGWRGSLLDHLLVWAFGLICLAVVSRQLLVMRIRRHRRDPNTRTSSNVAAP